MGGSHERESIGTQCLAADLRFMLGDVKLCLKKIYYDNGGCDSLIRQLRKVFFSLFVFLSNSMGYILHGEDTVALFCYAMVFYSFCYGCSKKK